MRIKILNAILIATSFFGYLEWGSDQSEFLFQVEYKILTGLWNDPASVIHPFTIIPLLGQILLLITLFQKVPGKRLTYMGMLCLGLLFGLMFVIAIMVFNLKMLASTLPFVLTSAFLLTVLKRS